MTSKSSGTGRVADMVVMVTGASGGIGDAICQLFKDQGAVVVGVDKNLPKSGDDNYECDLASDAEVAQLALKITGSYKLNTVIHAAAATEHADTLGSSTNAFLDVFNVNVVGAVRLVQAFAGQMSSIENASFLFISSINGECGAPGLSAYAASKGALNTLCRTLSLELADDGIRVNALAPASIDTDMLRSSFAMRDDPEQAINDNIQRHPLNRLGLPEDVANYALFLSSSEAAWVTGGVHLIDGGAINTRR